MTDDRMTTLNGTLVRQPDGWSWKDGTPEPRVCDRPMAYFAPNFRVCGGHVEIPRGWERMYYWDHAADTHRAIRGLIREAGKEGGVFAERVAGLIDDHRIYQPGWRVPVEMWDAVMAEPVGAGWDGEHEADILARARALGWHDPR